MTEINIKEATDEQLEEIMGRAENTHVSGSQFEKAKIELDIRRKRRLFEQQEKVFELQERMLTNIQSKLDGIIKAIQYISRKPIKALLIAGLGAILIGVTINLTSTLLTKIFGW